MFAPSRRRSGPGRTMVSSAVSTLAAVVSTLVSSAVSTLAAVVSTLVGAALIVACGTTAAHAPQAQSSTAPTTVAPSVTATVPAPPTTRAPATPPTTSAPATPPTTTWIATAPQPNAAAAAAALVSDWATTNRAGARSVATPQAIAAIFSAPYPGNAAIDRGCTSDFPPIVCTYGPPGGGPSTDPLYQIYVTQSPSGWYVSSVTVES